jgi:hypothetical protein
MFFSPPSHHIRFLARVSVTFWLIRFASHPSPLRYTPFCVCVRGDTWRENHKKKKVSAAVSGNYQSDWLAQLLVVTTPTRRNNRRYLGCVCWAPAPYRRFHFSVGCCVAHDRAAHHHRSRWIIYQTNARLRPSVGPLARATMKDQIDQSCPIC